MKKLITFLFIIFHQISFSQIKLNDELNTLINNYYPEKENPGIMLQVIDVQGRKIYAKGQGLTDLRSKNPISERSNFRMASVSKQFTAMSILILEEEGKLDLHDTSLSFFFPKLKGPIRNSKISNLLNHSSGIIDYENLISDRISDQLSDADVLKLVEPIDSVYFTPGEKFRYSNTGYCLLALIVEKVSKMDYSSFVKARIFDPLQMNNSIVYNPTDKIIDRAYGYHLNQDSFIYADQSLTSATKGDGGVYTSAVDFRKWNTDFQKLIKGKQNFETIFNNNIAVVGKDISYSLGKFRGYDQFSNEVYFHSGESTGFNNFVLTIPKRSLSISLFSNRDDEKIGPFIKDLMNVLGIKIKGLENQSIFPWLSSVYSNHY